MPRKRKVAVINQENVEPDEKVVIVTKKTNKNDKTNKKQKLEPAWTTGDGLNVIKIILSMQKGDCNASKCITELTKLYRKMDHKTFMTALLKMTRMFMSRDDGDDAATRVLKFIGLFVASFGEEVDEQTGATHALIQDMFKEILTLTSSIVHVRARLCTLVTQIMSSFSQKAEIDESIINSITDQMVYFIKDVAPNVRAQAILALQRLQDPDNPDDVVTKSYIFHMESDPAPKVRQAAITAIAKKITNMPYIIERLHDVDEKVRRHTYLQMASFSVKSYKIADRIAILNTGLNDRSDLVKKTVVNILLANWVGVYDYDYAEVIRAIKLDSSERNIVKFRKLADQTLNEIFKKRKLSDMIAYLKLDTNQEFKNCLTLDRSYLEMLLVWKATAKFHQEYTEGRGNEIRDVVGDSDEENESNMNNTISNIEIMPELSIFCDYITKFVTEFKLGNENDQKLSKMYFSQSLVVLLEMVQLNDLGDDFGKERLQNLLRKILIEYDVSEYVIEVIAKIIENIIPSVELRLQFFNSIVKDTVKIGAPSEQSRQTIIQDLINRSDIDTKVKANNIKLKMMDLKEQETLFVERKQYAECQKVSEEWAKLNNELIEILKPVAELSSVESTQSLNLLECLSSTVVKTMNPTEVLKNLRICYYAISSKGVRAITHEILSIYQEFVRFHLESNDIMTRIWALKTATAYALLYESLSQEIYYILKSQIFRNSQVFIWECSIECIIDLLLRYSIDKMDDFGMNNTNMSMSAVANMSQNRSKRGGRTLYTDDDGEDVEDIDETNIIKNLDIMQMLLHVIEQSVDKRILRVTIGGICKLIIHGAYCTRDIISKFLLMYFNPATDSEITQVLGVFLENIRRRKKQEYLHDAFQTTIVTLLEAPTDSPLREVKLEGVVKYIVDATRPIYCSIGLNLHNTLATKFLEFMHDNNESKEILKIFAKELLVLEIGDDPLLKKDMSKTIDKLLADTTADPRTKKNIIDFRSMLNGTYKVPLKFSSTAKVTVEPEEEDEGLENIEEENEDEINNDDQVPQEQTKEVTPEPPSADTSLNVSPSKKKLLDVSLKIPKLNTTQNETLTEDIQEIPASPQHIELPATQMIHVEIEASQQMQESINDDDVTVLSSDDEMIPTTPATPLTVKPKRQRAQKEQKHEEFPPTPVSTTRAGKQINAKRVLEISRSSPATPSVSSPIRKARKSVTPSSSIVASTPKMAAILRTPRSEGTRMTRNQAKEEMAQNLTLTRSASKSLNVKPIEVPKKPATKEIPEKKVAAVSKLPVKKVSASTTRSQVVKEPQNEASQNTRQMRNRGTSQPTATTSRASKGTGNKASSTRPPWK